MSKDKPTLSLAIKCGILYYFDTTTYRLFYRVLFYVQYILRNVLFSFTNLFQGNVLYCPIFFMPTKDLHTARTPTELKQNLMHCPILSSYWASE